MAGGIDMAEGLLGGMLGGDGKEPHAEARQAVTGAEAFAAQVRHGGPVARLPAGLFIHLKYSGHTFVPVARSAYPENFKYKLQVRKKS
jgi:hypothetical protein